MGNASVKSKALLVLFVLSLNLISSVELGIKPLEIKLDAETGEMVCESITLTGSTNFILQNKWNNETSRDLIKYVQEAEFYNINVGFSKQKTSNNPDKEIVEVCFNSKKPGVYYGALMFRVENSNLGFGNWIMLNITSENYFSKITGFITNSEGSLTSDKKVLWLIIPTLVLALIFGILLIIKKRISH